MTQTKDSALPIITCHKAYIAFMNENGSYGTPEYCENLTEIGIEKSFSSDPFYAEGVKKFVSNVLSSITATVSLGDLEEDKEVRLLGHRKDRNGLVVKNVNDKAATVALMYTMKKADNTFRGYVYYDGKFAPSGVGGATAEGSANYQVRTISAEFKALDNGDTDAEKFLINEAAVEEFFKEVPIPDFSEGVQVES